MHEALKKQNFEVFTAYSAEKAIAILEWYLKSDKPNREQV